MKRSLFRALLLIGGALPLPGFCSSVLPAAHALNFGTYGNGNVWVTLDQPHDQVGCPGPYIDLAANGAANKSVLAAAAFALATGATVFVQVDGCVGKAGTLTGARDGVAFGVNRPPD